MADTNYKFRFWMNDVKRAMIKKIGLDPDDLPDFCYMDAFEDGMEPEECVEAVLEENEYDSLL